MRQTRALSSRLLTLQLADSVGLYSSSSIAVASFAFGVGRNPIVDSVSVVSLGASLTIEAGGVVDALETFSRDAVAVADGVAVVVGAAFARRTRASPFCDLVHVAIPQIPEKSV